MIKSLSPLIVRSLNRDSCEDSKICNMENECFLSNKYKTFFPVLNEMPNHKITKLSQRNMAVFKTYLSIFSISQSGR